MVHFRTHPERSSQSKHCLLLLIFNQERIDIGCRFPSKLAIQLLTNLLFELSESLFLSLDLSFLANGRIQTIDILLFEVILFVRHLELALFTSQEWFIHSVLVVQSGHVSCLWAIVVSKQFLMLAFPISLVLLQLELMLMVYLLRMFILALILMSIRTGLFMFVSFCKSLEYMLNIVHAIGARWLSVGLFLFRWRGCVSHHTTLTWLCLSQVFPVFTSRWKKENIHESVSKTQAINK